MMMDINMDSIRQGFWRHFPLAAVVGVVIAFEMAAVLMAGFAVTELPAPVSELGQIPAVTNNTKELGILLYTEYVYPLQIAAAILLVAMIAAIALTLRRRKDNKSVNPSDQVRVKSRDRMTVLQMPATKAALEVDPPAIDASELGEKKS
jgi:NADH-quinone oxidoreductase subunit J